jgi:hypothetical protein
VEIVWIYNSGIEVVMWMGTELWRRNRLESGHLEDWVGDGIFFYRDWLRHGNGWNWLKIVSIGELEC